MKSHGQVAVIGGGVVGSEDPACDTREWVDPDHYNTEFTEQ